MSADQAGVLGIHPLLRRDTVVLSRDGGALLHTGDVSAWFAGTEAYQLLARLRPHFTGRLPLGRICAALSDRQRAAVVDLVAELVERGLVLDAGPVEPEVADRFGPQLRYLAHLADEPARRFRRFRTARILLTGDGVSLRAAAADLLRNGAEHVLVDYADVLREVPGVQPPEPDTRPDLTVHCADRGGASQVLAAIRDLRPGGPPLLAMAAVGGWAVLGPVTRAGRTGCWSCAWTRLDAPEPGPAGGGPLTPTVARMLGGAAAYEAFRLLTGLRSVDVHDRAVVQELRTLWVGRVGPLIGCPACGGTAPSAEPAPAVPARASRVTVVPDMPSRNVREYADAVHRVARERLPPADFSADWTDRPFPHSTFPATPFQPLPETAPPPERPFTETRPVPEYRCTTELVAWLLRTSYGPLSRRFRFDSNQAGASDSSYPLSTWRRGTASGGGLYPLEIYWVTGGTRQLPAGVHHYAPSHHAAELLTPGDFRADVRRALYEQTTGHSDDFLLVSLRFRRNAFKYANFGYHVGTMDAGALLGTLTQLAAGAGVSLRPVLWFDDRAANNLLGLDPAEEGVLAIIPVAMTEPGAPDPAHRADADPPTPFETARTIPRFAWTQEIHRLTVLSTKDNPGPLPIGKTQSASECLSLPEPAGGTPEPVSALLHRRRSSFGALTGTPPVPLDTVATVLGRTARALSQRSDAPAGQTGLGLVATHVRGLPPGGYRYDAVQHVLHPTGSPAGRWTDVLDRIGAAVSNYSVEQAAAVLVVTGRLDAMLTHYGPRGLRMLNADAGAVLQIAYLAATAAGVGCGAVLNLDNQEIDEVLGLTGTGERTLVSLMIGGECRADADFDQRLY